MQLDPSIQIPYCTYLWLREPVDQSLSASCSTFGAVPRLSKDQTSRPVPERRARWLVQSPGCRKSRLVDQSPSISCSVVDTAPRLSKEQTGRPVPEHIMLGGRYSPQDIDKADWSTCPRAYHARWSVQSPGCRKRRLVDQSPSISCSVVGTVPRMSHRQTSRLVPECIMLGGRYSPQVHHVCLTKDPTYLFKKIISPY